MAEAFADEYLDALGAILQSGVDREAVDGVIRTLFDAYQKGRRIFIIGNGGSASTASHLMCDLAKGCAVEGKPRIRAMSLTDNVAVLTAVGNDVSYEKVFTMQLEVFLEPGDGLVAITVSGNSPNILDAVRYARDHGATVIGLIGFGGGKLQPLTHHDVTVASRNYGHVEDVHCILAHLVSQGLRQRILLAPGGDEA
jgi:D-sedoheptulose 7-phosphate isomerase